MSKELYKQKSATMLDKLLTQLIEEKGNKAAGTRARKAAGEFKKIVTDYRKASVSESK